MCIRDRQKAGQQVLFVAFVHKAHALLNGLHRGGRRRDHDPHGLVPVSYTHLDVYKRQGEPYVVRLKSFGDPNRKETFRDEIKGKLTVPENCLEMCIRDSSCPWNSWWRGRFSRARDGPRRSRSPRPGS